MTRNNWGGTRKGAGRPRVKDPKKTAVIRVDERLLPIIKILKEKQQSGEKVENMFNVTTNQDELQSELKQYKETGLKLVLERDKARLSAIQFESRCKTLQSDKKALTAQISAFQHQEHDCQALTKSGTRCSKLAKLKTNWHGVEINVCLQHSK